MKVLLLSLVLFAIPSCSKKEIIDAEKVAQDTVVLAEDGAVLAADITTTVATHA